MLALVASVLLWPCVILSVVLLGIHSWMALSSMTTLECVKGPESLGYLEVGAWWLHFKYIVQVSVGLFGGFLHFKYSAGVCSAANFTLFQVYSCPITKYVVQDVIYQRNASIY